MATEELPPAAVAKWVRPPTYGAPPPARGGATAACVGNLLLVFGGTCYDSGGKFTYYNDVWALELGAMRWHKPDCVSSSGKGPGPRYAAGACVIDYKVYIFGGKGPGSLVYNDLWCLDVERWTWSLLPSSTAPPSARYGHACMGVGDRVCVFGGTDGRACNNELWLFDTQMCMWVRPRVGGVSPTPRHYAAACYDPSSGRAILYGGATYAKDGTGLEYLGDTRVLDFKTLTWERPRVSGPSPAARYQAGGFAVIGNLAVVIGGWRGEAAAEQSAAGAAGSGEGATNGGGQTIQVPWQPGLGAGWVPDPDTLITVPLGKHADTFFLDLAPADPLAAGGAGGAGGAGEGGHGEETAAGGHHPRPRPPAGAAGAAMGRAVGPRPSGGIRQPGEIEWSQPELAGRAPGHRYGACVVASGTEDESGGVDARVFIFGGWEGGRAVNDLLVLDLAGLYGGGGGSGGEEDAAGEGGAGEE